jgi:hypothetical protein
MSRTASCIHAFAVAAAVAGALLGRPTPAPCAPAAPALEFGDAFWRHWGDGRAEIDSYDLVFPRYGEPRQGVAVAVYVTETFANTPRVKSDPGRHPATEEFPVLKLNLVRDFPTGIYDYNVMTSTFVALAPVNRRPAGSTTKVSFSSQEWCGNVYAQLLFDDGRARHTLHSYFDGEADRDEPLTVPNDAVTEDALLVWARGLATPLLAPGESRRVSLVRSLLVARLRHQPVAVERATLSRDRSAVRVTVPAGTFDTDVLRAAIGARTWIFHVERAAPRRVVQWQTGDGERARLVKSDRVAYWQMNAARDISELGRIGLAPRPPRTP